MSEIADNSALFAVAVLFMWAAIADMRSYRIPNAITLAIVAVYPFHLLIMPTPVDWAVVSSAVICSLVVFAVGAFLFSVKAMGGGDVKLLTAGALWAGAGQLVPFLVITAVAGAFVALLVALRALIVESGSFREAATGFRFAPLLKLSVPYGTAIAIGGFFVIGRMLVT